MIQKSICRNMRQKLLLWFRKLPQGFVMTMVGGLMTCYGAGTSVAESIMIKTSLRHRGRKRLWYKW